jgi:predicted AAA+ superfamily ATPase
VTGSAAAALRMKSKESGAGRFSDFVLPPLTFAEYLRFIKKENKLITKTQRIPPQYEAIDIAELNEEFINYLNYGGYPEAVFSEVIQKNTQQFIKNDIIDKVLLRDLPSLYGISDIQELNKLFTTLAYNTGSEISLDTLSKSAGVAKNTIRRYLDYLEAAFLIKRVERIDQNAKRFKRAMCFKVYLTNPSMRAALFGPVEADSAEMGNLTETAIFSQWQHSDATLYYARWNSGEVDIVLLDTITQKPEWAVEVKWSDRPVSNLELLDHCVELVNRNSSISSVSVTTRTITDAKNYKGIVFKFQPSSLYAYLLGHTILKNK